MSDNSVRNIVQSVGRSSLSESDHLKECKILYLYGSMINEYLLKRSAKVIRSNISQAKIICFEGYSHVEIAIYHSGKWIDIVMNFIQN